MLSGWDQNASATLVLILLALFIYASPFTDWWTGLRLPWYAALLPWLLLIALTALINRRARRHDL
jgi:hypothetical protein